MSDIGTNLAYLSQEIDGCHPFFRAQTCLSREVVEVADEALEDVGEAGIRSLRVDADGVLCDILDREIFRGRDLGFRWIHFRSLRFRLGFELLQTKGDFRGWGVGHEKLVR